MGARAPSKFSIPTSVTRLISRALVVAAAVALLILTPSVSMWAFMIAVVLAIGWVAVPSPIASTFDTNPMRIVSIVSIMVVASYLLGFSFAIWATFSLVAISLMLVGFAKNHGFASLVVALSLNIASQIIANTLANFRASIVRHVPYELRNRRLHWQEVLRFGGYSRSAFTSSGQHFGREMYAAL